MKICSFGSRHFGGQVDRIDEGFVALGHELTPHSHVADLIFSNDPAAFSQILIDRCNGGVHAKVIFNVQDIPLHLGSTFDSVKLKSQLVKADAVTTISEYVRWQVQEYLGLDSQVIYQPMKPVRHDPSAQLAERKRFAHVGRRFDSNKNFTTGVYALQMLGYQPSDVFLVGNEQGWGDYCGVLNDENLNRVYNSVDFVLTLGAIEGLSLPTVEAMACGVIPVVHNRMTTRRELLPPEIFPEYNSVDMEPASVARFISRFTNDPAAMTEMKNRLRAHYQTNWAHKLTGRAVAERILEAAKNIS
jgi:glycosyltransferase involved in cell wall biosynthesis